VWFLKSDITKLYAVGILHEICMINQKL